MQYELTCECGWQTNGDEDKVVRDAQQHGRDIHGVEPNREQVLAMARPTSQQ
jgi:predicted small metal-binding protein